MEPARPTLPDPQTPDAPAAGAPVRPTLPDTSPERPAAPRKPRRAWLIAALALLVILGVGAAVAYRPLLGYLVRREASLRGFTLDFDEVEREGEGVHLHGVRAGLVGVSGIQAEIEEIRVALDGLTPTRVDAEGVAITVVGTATDRLLELSAWSSDHPDLYRTPGAGSGIRLTWAARAGATPWLDLGGGVFTSDGAAAMFRAASATLEGVTVGGLGAAWAADASVIAIGVGKETVADAPIRVDLRPSTRPPIADVIVRPLKLEELGAPMGVGFRAPGAIVEGSGRLTLGEHAGRDAIEGSFALLIKGWVPPHPRQLDRVLAGSSTSLTARVRVSEDRRRVTISEATASAGSLKLTGKGAIAREGGEAQVTLDLDGQIPCSEVARSAATSDWGEMLGQLLGDVAQQAVEGAVDIHVHIEADTRDLRAARLRHQVGVGCGIRIPKLF
jgi:hypothetical protein